MSEQHRVEVGAYEQPIWWQRHLWTIASAPRPTMNAFTRWRPSALYPTRRYRPKRVTQPQSDRMRKPVKANV